MSKAIYFLQRKKTTGFLTSRWDPIDTVKKIGSHEKRIANDIIHNISREIVNRAIETNALIVLGDIKHLRRRRQNTKGRKFNRKLSGFQYYKLTQYIKYKAALAGIKVIQVSERWTSQYCRKCNRKGIKKIQGLFQCKKCKRTTCRFDGRWSFRWLLFTRLLCPFCAEAQAKLGHKVYKFKPLPIQNG